MTHEATTPAEPPESLFSAALPNLQIAWDSTSLGLLKECPRKYQYTILQAYQPTGFATHLAFGIAYHRALELYDIDVTDGADHGEALTETVRYCLSYGERTPDGAFHPHDSSVTHDTTKTRETLTRSVIWYLEHFRNDPLQTLILANGRPAVELSFKLNLQLTTPDGAPFLLCGHLDRVVTHDDQVFFLDRKTTKSAIDGRYWRQFTPSNQMSLYYAATKLVLAEPAQGGIIDAAQVLVGGTRFARHTIYRTPAQEAEWLEDTYHWLGIAMNYAAENHWPMNDKACGNFGGCAFQPICSRDPQVRHRFLAGPGFTQRRWNPLENR